MKLRLPLPAVPGIIEWVTAHGIQVEYRPGRHVMAVFDMPCRHLRNGLCSIYKTRPELCKLYDPEPWCEKDGPPADKTIIPAMEPTNER